VHAEEIRVSGWGLHSVAEHVNMVLLVNVWIPYAEHTGNLWSSWATVSIEQRMFLLQLAVPYTDANVRKPLKLLGKWRVRVHSYRHEPRADGVVIVKHIKTSVVICHLKQHILEAVAPWIPKQSLVNFKNPPFPRIISVKTPGYI
jgi:hypothetical protein